MRSQTIDTFPLTPSTATNEHETTTTTTNNNTFKNIITPTKRILHTPNTAPSPISIPQTNIKKSTPGPGHYYKPSSYVRDGATCGSVSARGYTAVISRTPRFGGDLEELRKSLTPGPGAYDPFSEGDKLASSAAGGSKTTTTTTTGSSSSVTTRTARVAIVGPGPGHYNTSATTKEEYISRNSLSSFFKSTGRSRRDRAGTSSPCAAVGSYDVGKSLDALKNYGKDPRKGKPFPCPSFSSTVERSVAACPGSHATPGPGCYANDRNLGAGVQKPSAMFYPENYYKIVEGRGSNVNGETSTETPGPGWYYRDKKREPNKGVTAPFRSKLPRFSEGGGLGQRVPGPAYYCPKSVQGKSFYMNKECKW
eukprot:CAMPEP_0172492464 /NCGR_PEP_ID=MMETSP1066-20121228/23630_1 /TAXON_ID=671091 /ORGANISM="Coscinodiscus wailesii, Strain CCMP2513" /LENGTH=364 /DNA_ID=CAMNT_0013262117 /DNA_START=107 /DNA_END=1198 /DNA_ORIENTATION=-